MKRLVGSHLDLDGLGSIVLYKYFQDRVPEMNFDSFMLIDYGWEQIPENISYMASFDEVILADISAPKEYIDQIRAKGTRVRIFDHHLSAEWLKDDFDSVWDKERSGTRIFWEEYVCKYVRRCPPVIRHFVDLVDAYDCWRENSPLWRDAKGLNSVLYGMKNWKAGNEIDSNREFMDHILRKLDLYPNEWIWMEKEKRLIEEAERREIELYERAEKEMRIRIDDQGKYFAIFPCGSKISLTCSSILKNNPGLDYCVCINSFRGINGKLSFRTKTDMNLNCFAGVNGHASAAAGQVTPEMADKIWKEDYVPRYREDPDWNEADMNSAWKFLDQDAIFPF